MFNTSSFLNAVTLWLPQGLNSLYVKAGLDDKLSRLPGDILLPEGVRNEIAKYIGYINFFIPHEVWFGFFQAVLAYVIIRVILSIVAEIWFG